MADPSSVRIPPQIVFLAASEEKLTATSFIINQGAKQ